MVATTQMVSVPVCRATKDCTGRGHPLSCSLARLQAGASRRVSQHLHVFICKMDLVGLWLPGGVLGTQDLATGKSPVNHGVQRSQLTHRTWSGRLLFCPLPPSTPTALAEHAVQASTVDLVSRYSECLFKYLSPCN